MPSPIEALFLPLAPPPWGPSSLTVSRCFCTWWATNAAYRAEVARCLDAIAPPDADRMRRALLRSGYADLPEILRDEMQAYMAGNGELLDADPVAVAPVARRVAGIFDAYRAEAQRAAADPRGEADVLEVGLTAVAADGVRFCVTLL